MYIHHPYMSHDTFISEACYIHICDMTHSYVWLDWFRWQNDKKVNLYTSSIYETRHFVFFTWLIHMCDMTHSYVWHDSFGRQNDGLVNVYTSSIYVTRHFVFFTWLIHMCDMTHLGDRTTGKSTYIHYPYMSHDTFIFKTCHMYILDLTHSYVWHDSFGRQNDGLVNVYTSSIYVTRHFDIRGISHSCSWHDSFICVTWLI